MIATRNGASRGVPFAGDNEEPVFSFFGELPIAFSRMSSKSSSLPALIGAFGALYPFLWMGGSLS